MKKTFLFSILTFFGLSLTFGQQSITYTKKDSVPRIVYTNLNERELAKIEIKGKSYLGETGNSLKSDGIKSVEPNKEKQALMIELKQDYNPVLISLSELKNKYTHIKSNRVIFRLDNNIIQNNPDEVLVDVGNIMLISVSPIKFISDLEDLFMITLITRTDSNIKKFNTIRVR